MGHNPAFSAHLNKEMSALLKDYFDSSRQTLVFCSSLGRYLPNYPSDQCVVDAMLQLVLTSQNSMIERLLGQLSSLYQKLSSLATWRKVSTVIVVSVLVAVLIWSVVAAPPVVTALAVPVLGCVGGWCASLWNRYSSEVEGQTELVRAMYVGTLVSLKDLNKMRFLFDEIQAQTDGPRLSLQEHISVKTVTHKIKTNLEIFMETTEILSLHNNRCNPEITMPRNAITQRIAERYLRFKLPV